MVLLTAEEAAALLERLEGSDSGRAAAGTFSVSANASTSVTFTDVEKGAVLAVLQAWLPSQHATPSSGLVELEAALAHDLGT
jgi:hypothetical protein